MSSAIWHKRLGHPIAEVYDILKSKDTGVYCTDTAAACDIYFANTFTVQPRSKSTDMGAYAPWTRFHGHQGSMGGCHREGKATDNNIRGRFLTQKNVQLFRRTCVSEAVAALQTL